MTKGNSAEAESWILWDGTGKEDIWYPAIAMLSGVIELHPELKMRGKKSQLTSLQKQLVDIIIVKP